MLDLIKRNLLKIVMLADGGFSLLAGAVLAAFPAPIAGLLGPAFASQAVLGIGVFLIAWGIFHLAAGRTESLPPAAVRFAIIGDVLWVVASATLLIAEWNRLSGLGVASIAVVAVAVADIMLLKMIGLRGRQPLVAA
ncbi:MAG: putative rane protein [Rhizobium sp.]|nr:putative rane protein [Rhizobium sp.]